MSNPFDDSSYYKSLIDADESPNIIDVDSDAITPDEVKEVTNEFLDSNTSLGFPSSAFEAIKAAREKSELNKATQRQMVDMFEQLFGDLNKKFGLDIKIDFNSWSKSLSYIIEPKNKKALELYLSEAYGRFRVVLYGQYLQAIALLSSQVLNPDYILSDSMTYDDKLKVMEQLYGFMQKMNEIYEQVNIPDTELKLEKISEDTHKINADLNDPKIREFLESLVASVKNPETSEA